MIHHRRRCIFLFAAFIEQELCKYWIEIQCHPVTIIMISTRNIHDVERYNNYLYKVRFGEKKWRRIESSFCCIHRVRLWIGSSDIILKSSTNLFLSIKMVGTIDRSFKNLTCFKYVYLYRYGKSVLFQLNDIRNPRFIYLLVPRLK